MPTPGIPVDYIITLPLPPPPPMNALQELMGSIIDEVLAPIIYVLQPVAPLTTSEKLSKWFETHGKNLQRATIIGEMFGFMAVRNEREAMTSIYSTLVPEIICGAVPLYSVQAIERGMSDREVKYRATGDVFLAHQRGTTDSLRIDGTLMGAYRHLYLMFLLRLQNLGEADLKELAMSDAGANSSFNVKSSDITRLESGKPVMYESHRTFPIITQSAVLLDMFLQTIEWHSGIEDGIDIIKYTLLFRKHIEPKGWRALSDQPKRVELYYDDSVIKRQREEAMYDLAWKIAKMGGELYRGKFFGGLNSVEINREAIASDPYGIDFNKMLNGMNIDLYGEVRWVK